MKGSDGKSSCFGNLFIMRKEVSKEKQWMKTRLISFIFCSFVI